MTRRRRAALAGIAAVAGVAGAAVGAGAGGEEPPAAPSATGPSCPPGIAGDRGRLAGQLVVGRLAGGAGRQLRRAARRGEISGVIVFPPEGALAAEPEPTATAIERLQAAARRGGNPPLLVMVDQEGGAVKRFPAAPPQRAPAQLAEVGAAGDSRLEGQATGNFLAGIGIDVDLAPVIDVAASEEAALAPRAFGSDPGRVRRLGLAFARGLADEGVLAVPKHFPGLGRAEISTDAAPVTIDVPERALRADLVPFRAAIEDGVEALMASLAVYPALDPERPAALSRPVIEGLLRNRLGFGGVVLTDDLEAAALAGAGIGAGEAAVRAARAGSDLLLFALGGAGEGHAALVRALRRGDLDPARAREACARVVALKRGAASAE